MKIGVLTSSRADFGIYLPLILKLEKDTFFDVEIIAFGTHLSQFHGFTINEVESYSFKTIRKIKTPLQNDTAQDISNNIGKTIQLFSEFWNNHSYDLIFALGDRYEMFAAVTAASPFNLKIAHLHGGETTLGAIDNLYRHAISLMSQIIFVSTNVYKKKAQTINPEAKVYCTGALSVDNLKKLDYYTLQEFQSIFNIDLSIPSILATFHPETVAVSKNLEYINEILLAFESLKNDYQIIITLPNADTMGDMIKEKILDFAFENSRIKVVSSFGMKGYLTCMKYCKLMLGNTSSGFVEALFFSRWVINLGNRQQGRIETPNIITTEINKKSIIKAVEKTKNQTIFAKNIYGNGNTANKIIKIIKNC